MNDKNGSNFLYFDDEEIEKEKTENKQIFVTKRLEGKETHNIKRQIQAEKRKDTNNKTVEEKISEKNELIIDIPINPKSVETPQKSNDKRRSQKPKEKVESKKNNKSSKKSVKTKNNKRNKNSKKAKENKNKLNIKNKNVKKRNNKKKKRNSIIPKIILLGGIIASIVIFTFVTPVFNITSINVSGNNRLSENTIISISGLSRGVNIFKNRKSSIKKNLKENPYIEDVTIKRKLPGTIEIDITERIVEYQIKVMDSFIYIDKQGYILEKVSSEEEAIFIEGYETKDEELLKVKRLNNNDLIKLSAVQKIINAYNSAEIIDKIEKIDISNSKEYILYLNNKQIYVGDDSNLTDKMGYIKTILDDVKDSSGIIFVNRVSSGLKPYFRPEE